MPFTTLTGGLELVIPTDGTVNWGPTVLSGTWNKINSHRHTGAGDGNQLTSASFAANSLSTGALSKNLALTKATTLTPTGTTETMDLNNGNGQCLDLSSATGDVTLTINNPVAGAHYTLIIAQGAVKRTVVWPASVKFQGAASGEPTQYAAALLKSIITMYYDGSDFLVYAWENDLA
jgi:hypothetical protein